MVMLLNNFIINDGDNVEMHLLTQSIGIERVLRGLAKMFSNLVFCVSKTLAWKMPCVGL